MGDEVVQVGVAHHPLVGHVGRDEAVAVEGDVPHGVSGTDGRERSSRLSPLALSTSHLCCFGLGSLELQGTLEPPKPAFSFTEEETGPPEGQCLPQFPKLAGEGPTPSLLCKHVSTSLCSVADALTPWCVGTQRTNNLRQFGHTQWRTAPFLPPRLALGESLQLSEPGSPAAGCVEWCPTKARQS